MMQLSRMFQDHAVFQQDVRIPVWGNTGANHKLKCEFAGQTLFTKSSATGSFTFRIAPLTAGGPYPLTVTDLTSGEVITLQDILVGEVWIASGQSNMEYTLGCDLTTHVVCDREEDRPKAIVNRQQEAEFCSTIPEDVPTRFLIVKQAATALGEDTFEGTWQILTPETAPSLSAVAAWFGRFLQEKKKVPVGLIISSWGGTRAEAWTSRAGLLRNPETAMLMDDIDDHLQLESVWEEADQTKSVGVADPGNKGFGKGFANVDFDDTHWCSINIPGSWIRQRISGNGALWVRNEIQLPYEWTGKELVLELGGIDKLDTTYLNGVQVGKSGEGLDTSVWNKPRQYTIPAGVAKAGRNVIAIRAYSFLYDGAFLGKPEDYRIRIKDSDEYQVLSAAWRACPEVDFGYISPSELFPTPNNPNVPGILYDGMIRPLIPYALRGAIWYQGESNALSIEDSKAYFAKMKALVQDWRFRWELGDFPFLQVQLANFSQHPEPVYNAKSTWAILREAQLNLCRKEPNVYMASAVDIGCHNDIHPQDKKSVGKRLAAAALHHVYGESGVVPGGPIYERTETVKNTIRVF